MAFIQTLQGAKYALSIVPQSINGTDTLGTAVDTLGFHYAQCIFHSGDTGAAVYDNLAVQTCETSGGTYADVTGAVFTAPASNEDNKFYVAYIDLRKGVANRFLKWRADPGAAASLLAAFIILYRGDNVPDNVTDQGTVQTKVV